MTISEVVPRAAGRPSAPARWAGLAAPQRLAVLAIALVGVQVHGVASFDLAPSDVLLVGHVAVTGLRVRYRTSTAVRCWIGVLVAGMVLGLFAATAAFTPQSPAWGVVRLVGLGTCIGYALVTSGLGTGVLVTALRWTVVVAAAVNALILFAPTRPLLVWLMPQRNIGARLSGGMWDPNANGVLLASALIVALFSSRGTFRPVARAVLVLVLGLTLAYTFSRGAFVGLAAGCAVAAAVQATNPRRLARVVGVTAALGVIVAASGLIALVQQRLDARPDTLTNRYAYLEFGIRSGLDNPLFGGGLGRATFENGAFVHATAISLFGDAGLFAMVGYLGLVAVVAGAAWRGVGRRRRAGDGPGATLLACLLGAHVSMFVASLSFDALLQRQWWVVMGAIAGLTARPPSPREVAA